MPRRKRPSELVSAHTYEAMLTHGHGECHVPGCRTAAITRRLHIDHDHRTHELRGLLCHSHNRRLWKGATPEELRAMAEYLEQPRLWGKLPL